MNLTNKVRNKFWRMKTGPLPKFDDFERLPSEEMHRAYPGPIAELFFKCDEAVGHKWLHYLPIYEKFFAPFRGTPVRFLEIGVCKGGSLQMWRRFFGADATIFGIDIDRHCSIYNGQYAQVRIGSQDDPAFLASVVNEMAGIDIVLDDGSHICRHQKASYEALFPLLSDGGLYMIEDLQTAYWPHLEGGPGRHGTVIEYLKGKIDEMHRHYYRRGLNTVDGISPIESIQFYDSMSVITKRKQAPRCHVKVPASVP